MTPQHLEIIRLISDLKISHVGHCRRSEWDCTSKGSALATRLRVVKPSVLVLAPNPRRIQAAGAAARAGADSGPSAAGGGGFTAFIGPATQQLDIAIYDFRLIDGPLTDQIVGATTRIKVASMVISSGKILQALANQLNAGRDVAGIYDGPEMNNVVRDWQRAAPGSAAAQHLALWESIAPRLAAKASEPFTTQGPHNFMHNKVVVADGTTATGSLTSPPTPP
jgi:phosphatidylserine/phosphatidylglycerophosphate/cardiolipin synthase-like enzyme